MVANDIDEAVLVIQRASRDIENATKKLEDYEGKQDELLAAVKVLTERVANLEDSPSPKAKKESLCSTI